MLYHITWYHYIIPLYSYITYHKRRRSPPDQLLRFLSRLLRFFEVMTFHLAVSDDAEELHRSTRPAKRGKWLGRAEDFWQLDSPILEFYGLKWSDRAGFSHLFRSCSCILLWTPKRGRGCFPTDLRFSTEEPHIKDDHRFRQYVIFHFGQRNGLWDQSTFGNIKESYSIPV